MFANLITNKMVLMLPKKQANKDVPIADKKSKNQIGKSILNYVSWTKNGKNKRCNVNKEKLKRHLLQVMK